MLKTEQNYDFRKRLCTPHKRIYRIKGDSPREREIEIRDGDLLYVSHTDEVSVTAAKDFVDYTISPTEPYQSGKTAEVCPIPQ